MIRLRQERMFFDKVEEEEEVWLLVLLFKHNDSFQKNFSASNCLRVGRFAKSWFLCERGIKNEGDEEDGEDERTP